MIQLQKQWFSPVPWETILSINQALCQAKSQPHQPSGQGYSRAQTLWESSLHKTVSLQDALEICARCCQFGPFMLYNANTFAAVGRTLLEDGLKLLPPVEAQIIRTTVSHFIAGAIEARELANVLKHFDKLWHTVHGPTATIVPLPSPVPRERSSARPTA